MRICFVTPEYVTEEANYDGGLSNYLHRIAISLRQAGHEPVIVVASRSTGTLHHKGIEVNRVPALWFNKFIAEAVKFLPGLEWKAVSWQLNRVVAAIHKKRPLDIVQYASVGATAWARHRSIPSVVRVSGNQKLWDIAYEEKMTRARRIYQELEIEALKQADSLFGPSRVIADYLSRTYHFPVDVIESPFVRSSDPAKLDALKGIREQLAGKPYLLFFGSLGLAKGIKTIADTAFRILDTFKDIGIVLVGKDLGYNGKPIMVYVKEKAGIHADRVVWHDRVRHDQLYPIIDQAKMVLLPSRIDNFPNCCVEAMAFRKVVIGTRGASFEQLIEDGASGFLCRPDDAQDLFQVLARAMSLGDEALSEMGERAFRKTLTLSPEKITDKLIAHYALVKSRFEASR